MFTIECYYSDGSLILGNLDGQAVIKAVNYRRTNAYKRLLTIVGNPRWMDGKVAFAKIVSDSGVVETVKPKRFEIPKTREVYDWQIGGNRSIDCHVNLGKIVEI